MKREFWGALMLLICIAAAAYADWSRDIVVPSSYDGAYGSLMLDRGAVVAELVPAWAGKEIVQCSEDSVFVMNADNGATPIGLAIPVLFTPEWYGQSERLWIEDQPAVGDVDGDGYNDIVVGINRTMEPYDEAKTFGAVVWWTYNPGTEQFDEHHYYPATTSANMDVFRTPVICRTGWNTNGPTVAFYGRTYHHIANPPTEGRQWRATVFDLTNPNNPMYAVAKSIVYSSGTFERSEREPYTVAAGDLDGDGSDELVVNDWNKLYALSWDGNDWVELFRVNLTQVQGYTDYIFCSGGTTLADVDADGDLEVLAPAVVDTSINHFAHLRLFRFGPTGQLELVYGENDGPANPYDNPFPEPGVADLSAWLYAYGQDFGTCNPLVFTDMDTRMYFPGGNPLPSGFSWPFRHIPTGWSTQEYLGTALAKATDLQRPQIVYSSVDWDETNQPSSCKMYDFLDVSQPYAVVSLTQVPTGGTITHSGVPVVADIDGDGNADMVLSVKRTYGNDEHHYIVTKNLTEAHNPEWVYWSQFQNGPDHKGLYAQPVTGAQQPDEVWWSGRMTLHGTYSVGQNQILHIAPGAVVELMPNAELYITGSLQAIGLEKDSIAFTELGGGHTAFITLGGGSETNLHYCRIHGMLGILGLDPLAAHVEHCRAFDTEIGMAATSAARARLSAK